MTEYPETTKAVLSFAGGMLFFLNVLLVWSWIRFVIDRWPK